MSESDKMGLFGSKDENNEPTSEEKKNCENSKENSSDRYAPYNIDSDSETYDTEALSIMDINDIIGVQADTPGDSTLESEFAALSEIITDSKDEFVTQVGVSAGAKENLTGSYRESMQQGRTIKDPAQGDSKNERVEVKKLQNPLGMACMSKSLQLIGEAYISEDSQETDTDDAQECGVKKSMNFRESLEVSKNSEKDTKVTLTNPREEVTNPESENSKEIISRVKNDPKSEGSSLGSAESSVKSSKTLEIIKSADSTDSVIVNVREKPKDDKTESMDVDSTASSDIVEKLSVAVETFEKSNESKDDVAEISYSSEIEHPVVETKNSTIESAEMEVPMEVDETNAEKFVAIAESPITRDIVDTQPEVSKKSPDDDSDKFVEFSSDARIIEKEAKKTLKDTNDKSEPESLENPRNEKSVRVRSESPKNEKYEQESSQYEKSSLERKDEMETDEPMPEKSIVEEIRSKSPNETLEESIIELAEVKSTRDDETKVEKREFEEVKSSENSDKVEEIVKEDSKLVEPEEASEPMEIDSTEQRKNEEDVAAKILEKKSENVESVSDHAIKDETNDENAEETLESTTKSSEIPDAVDKEILPDFSLTESSNENFTPVVEELCEKSLKIRNADVTSKESCDRACDEDERMEVDGSSKGKIADETIHVSAAFASLSEKIEEFTIKEKNNEVTILNESSIDTVDDSAIAAPEVERIEKILVKDVPSESSNEKTREIIPTGNFVETDEMSRESEKKVVEPNENEKEILAETKIVESIIESREKEEMEISDGKKDEASDKGDKEFEISIQVPRSSNEENRQLEETELPDDATQRSIEDEKNEIIEESKREEEETSILIEKTESPKEDTREIEDGESGEAEDRVENEKTEIERERTREEKKISISSEKVDCSDGESQEIADKKLIEDAVEDSGENEKMEIESASNENENLAFPEKAESTMENLISPRQADSSNEEKNENSISPEKAESSNDEKENLISSRQADSSNKEKNENSISPEKAESSNDEKENLISSQQADSSNEEKNENSISPEKAESSNDEKENLISSQQADSSNEEKNENSISPEKAESSNDEKENLISSRQADSSNEEKNENSISPEKAESSNDEKENLICPEKAESSSKEKMETSTASVQAQFSHEEENLIFPDKIESSIGEEKQDLHLTEKSLNMEIDKHVKSPEKIELSNEEDEENINFTEKMESPNFETEENPRSPGVSELSNRENEKNVISPEAAESLNEEEKEISIPPVLNKGNEENAWCSEKAESLNEEEEEKEENLIFTKKSLSEDESEVSACQKNVESSIDNSQEIQVAKSSQQDPGETSESEKNEASTDSEAKSSMSIRETTDDRGYTEETPSEQEDQVSSTSKLAPEESNRSSLPCSSTDPSDLEIVEDQAIEEMNNAVEPEILESSENLTDENSRSGESSPERMTMEPEMETTEASPNLSLDPEEKNEETNLVRLNDRTRVQSSAYKSDENYEENIEKSIDDPDENLKDILSASSVRVTQIFHDDEQSQSTQEMMESILETDKGNINKILDDQEADDLESSKINDMAKLPNESDDMLSKALEDPMATQNIDSLEGLLDLDLMPENDESNLKAVEPIVDKVMQESCDDDMETIGKNMDVSLLMEVNDTIEDVDQSEDYETRIATKIMNADEIASSVDDLMNKSTNEAARQLQGNSNLTEKVLEAFDLDDVVANPLENDDPSDVTKIHLAEDLLCEIEEGAIKLTEKLLLSDNIPDQDLLLSSSIQQTTKIDIPDEVFLPVETEPDMELTEDISLDSAVRDQVLDEVEAEIENMPPSSEISELESAVKFLQESEEQDIDLPLVLSPKMVENVVDDIGENSDVGIFADETDICEDPAELVAELESIIPDPIAISEAEIINEAAKLEIERKTKFFEETKLSSPLSTKIVNIDEILETKSSFVESSDISDIAKEPEKSEIPRESREIIEACPLMEKIQQESLNKSVKIPKISILEERLKVPPKIEIPVGEITRMCELPTTPRTSLLIQRDVRAFNSTKQLESPKSMEKSDGKIVDTPRKDNDKHDFENVGSPRIILKIAKSAIADCSEPRSPKSPKIRSATNSPNPEDSPGHKLGKIKLKLSKGGHPSIISNDHHEEQCGQWHTEGSSSLSPLGMRIKFSKISESANVQGEGRHEAEETREQASKHKFEEARRTESPLGMKIKLSRTGEPSIVQQDAKESPSAKGKDKMDISQQDSPRRTESPIGMKIKLSKSGDASIIQPDKQETMDEHRDGGSRIKEKCEISQQHNERSDTPRGTESPLGIKFKLFKTGDASIVQPESPEDNQQDVKRTDSPVGKKIKISKSRAGVSSIGSEHSDDIKDKLEIPEVARHAESSLGMKIKLSKRGDASIIQNEESRETTKQRTEIVQETAQMPDGTSGVRIKVVKSSTIAIQSEVSSENEAIPGIAKRADPTIGMKIKLSKSGDASIVHTEREIHTEENRDRDRIENIHENIRKIDSSIGMKIKLSRTGEPTIIQTQATKKNEDQSSLVVETREMENSRINDVPGPARMKQQKSAEAATIETMDRREKSLRRKETEMPLEMKIKLSKTGHPTIVACDNYPETSSQQQQRVKEIAPETSSQIADSGKTRRSASPKINTGIKMLKGIHGAGLHGGRSELTIEPIQLQSRKIEHADDPMTKRKEITISPIESKKAKLEAKLSQMLPEVTIQPIIPRETKQQMMFETKAGSISRQQMNVISQEISITQVRSSKPMDLTMTDKLKSMLTKNTKVASNDCEIIEHRPELIIVNENSNSSQDVMIIEEVPAIRGPETKIPKKRGRPRRNPVPLILAKPTSSLLVPPIEPIVPRDPLALDDVGQIVSHIVPKIFPPKDNEAHGRPKRTCRSQKSYAPPRRGRGRGGGRGKRKMDMVMELPKRPRMEQDFEMMEHTTTALITIHEPPSESSRSIDEPPSDSSPGSIIETASDSLSSRDTSELYKALRQPTMDRKLPNAIARDEIEQAVNDTRNDPDLMTKHRLESLMDARLMSHLDGVINTSISNTGRGETFEKERNMLMADISIADSRAASVNSIPEELQKSVITNIDDKIMEKIVDDAKNGKDSSSVMDHENWLTPSAKKQCDGRSNEGNISNVQAMDEETRMSAESGSRSQTPAKNMSLQAPETIVNEESQGSVLSTATTESEKVKVKNRRMEISFDPDEGPFTVDKVAEYDWPLDPMKKNETFMIQEQISHYLGVKSFKRKYPDLKRRMVDMEERNYLRENGLVSEAMCDMGLTAVLSSEVLDVMCSDFPDQYEEYRKYIREKQLKEHFKKQKELTAAANAEKNRIDLAEMAVQSALSWNVGLNKARRESRKCSLDLQTFTIHVPKKQQKVEEERGDNHYPVALIPGQYTDYYREYTPAELRYYPLNTVLYGPMRPNERKFDSQSEGSQSDSDSDSSSDDSSSSSSEGTQDTEASQSTMDDVDAELTRQKEDIKTIKCKMCLKHLNKFSRTEVLIQCGTCNGYVHPSCIDLTLDMVPHIQAYAWQCTDCKTCVQCHDPADEDKMLFCDMCDRGYHIYCVGLRRVPQGRWHCQECAVCASCGSREAGGANSDRNSVAQWQHEYKKGDKNTRVYVSTLCVPCSKLWRKGRYCPHCSRCHTVPRLDLEVNLVHCSACDKYLHLGCLETKDLIIDRKNYRCDFCQPLRHLMVKPLVSKVFRT